MFERFTERARSTVVHAQDAARTLKHNYIGTEHILVGLAEEREGVAGRVLSSLGVTAEMVSADIEKRIGLGEVALPGQIPFTPRSKKVYDFALREALSLGHNYIGTEHILLALMRENEGVGALILHGAGHDAEKVRDAVIRAVVGPRPRSQPAGKPKPTEVATLREVKGLTHIALKNGQHLTVAVVIDDVMHAVREAGDGLIGFRCLDDRMRYVARDQIALVEPDPLGDKAVDRAA